MNTVDTAASWIFQGINMSITNTHVASQHAPRRAKPHIMGAQHRHAEPYADDLRKL